MASFYEVEVSWLSGSKTTARAVGNNAAWLCACGEVLLGPTRYGIDPCPRCGKRYEVVPVDVPGSHVAAVREIR
jgi:hypothetical protein